MTNERETGEDISPGPAEPGTTASPPEPHTAAPDSAAPKQTRPEDGGSTNSRPTNAGPRHAASKRGGRKRPGEPNSDGAAESAADAQAESAADADPDSAPAGETRWRRRKRLNALKTRRKAPWWELPALVLLAIGIAILVKSFIVQPFYIPSESMEKTLHGCAGCQGDRILVNKPIYSVLRDPEPGDIVVFGAPTGWDDELASTPPSNPVVRAVRGFGQLVGFVPPDGQVLVKRVIAVGGQTVKGDGRGHVMISTHGAAGPYRTLDEPYVNAPAAEAGNQVPFGPVTIPKDRLWVMGDHRTDSADSRFHCSPGGPEGTANDANCDPRSSTVPVDKVIGKAFVIAWPPSRWDILGTPSTFESAAAVAGPALPAVVSVVSVVPVFLVRRRRRVTG